MEAWDRYPERLRMRAANMQQFSAALLNHVSEQST